jgi:protein-L-isoaspartate(D-aspartate) O-methyltransferase
MMATTSDPIDFAAMRSAMVASQLRTTAVADPRVVTAMATVPRERFFPAQDAGLAYRDSAMSLGGGRSANSPMATGKLLSEARVAKTDRVLLIGAATGYTAAVLSMLAADVVAVECDAALVATARESLADRSNVAVVEGELAAGHAASGPYDVLAVDGAVERLPDTLVDQLKPRGRIVTGIVDRGVTRLASGVRSEFGAALIDFADVDCVVLPGFAAPRTFSF